MRKVLAGLGLAVVAVAGVIGLALFLAGRDDSTTTSSGGPGAAAAAASGQPFLKAGNIAIAAPSAAEATKLKALARDVSGSATPSAALQATGQAIRVTVQPGAGDITATAYRRVIHVQDPADPALRAFVEYWLGRGAQD